MVDRLKSLRIDPRSANQSNVAGFNQAVALKVGKIVGILHDQTTVRAAKGEEESGPHQGPKQAGCDAIAGEDVAEAGDSVDAGNAAGQASGQSAVDHTFKGKVVGEVGMFLSINLADWVEKGKFTQEVEAAPLHRDSENAEAGGLQAGYVGAGWGEHHHLMALVAQVAG